MEFQHQPVLLNETIDNLFTKDGIYIDGTAGGGGHSSEILKRLQEGKLICFDKDGEAIKVLNEKFEANDKVLIVHDDFKNFEQHLDRLQIEKANGILLDLGVSSYQLDNPQRGFSYRYDTPLNMKMDTEQALSAYNVVNEYEEKELVRILFEYGEERFARRIVSNILKQRAVSPIETTGQLSDIIFKSVPKDPKGGNPCKRSFQAIRIEVNGELSKLYECVISMGRRLAEGGRIAIITFHSLEDRIVKNAFKYLESDCICDKSLPICTCNKNKEINIITKKPITAGKVELTANRRSESAKLRVAEKVIKEK